MPFTNATRLNPSQTQAPKLRPATPADLEAINAVIERAVMTWKLPERVKRLALPGYRYNRHDLESLHLLAAENAVHNIVGVAAWERADPRNLPAGQTGLLLHGLYVDPDWQRQGLGARLLEAAGAAAREEGFDGLLVKAQPDAVGFFLARGLEKLGIKDPARDYTHRLWMAATGNGR